MLTIFGNQQKREQMLQQDLLEARTQSKVVFALLCQPELFQLTYRQIAAKAMASLGVVNATVAKLKKQGFVEMKPKKVLINGKSLLEKWSNDFNQHWRKEYFRKQFMLRNKEHLKD